MELERIKQALRMRSGRSSKPKKAPRPRDPKAPDSVVTNGVPPKPANPPEQHRPASAQKEQSKSTERADKAFSLGPDGQGESNGVNGDYSTKNSPRQYGRSGIVVPSRTQTMSNPNADPSDSSDEQNFDLKAPAPNPRPPSVENLSELLFSAGHLNSLLHDPREVARFTAFLNKYQPEYQPLILRYLETQKAIKAIDYANAVAEGAQVVSNEEDKVVQYSIPSTAATLDKTFEEASNTAFTALVGTALPAYITYNLVKLVTECLINEITGKQSPMMRNMVTGLSEVFCLTDPNQDDNPIIYASEEFYRLTGYGRDDVIGHNCRFLQGRLTNRGSPKRLKESIQKGEELCETLLNYRRDGRPFINLLLIAPLHDDKGNLKYFIGAQADVTGLIEDGRGLDGFERFLAYRETEKQNKAQVDADSRQKKKALTKLRELSEMFDLEESAVVSTASRASSMSRRSDDGSVESSERQRRDRRLFVADDDSDEDEEEDDSEQGSWKLGQSGPLGLSGKLPGIYDTYMLIRAAPSLRIIFVSPKLRKLGKVVQSPFLSHVAAPATTLNGLKESFSTGTPVSARINFLPERGESRDGIKTGPGYKHEDGKNGRACWISATPLLGSDDRVGVWMIVFVEKAKAKRTAKVAEVEAKTASKAQRNKPGRIELPKREISQRGRAEAPKPPAEEQPIKPKRLDDIKDDSNRESSSTPKKAIEPDGSKDNFDSVPQNGEDSLSRTKNVDEGEDQFVRTKSPPKQTESTNRVDVQSDGDDDQEADKNEDWQPARSRSRSRSRSNTAEHHPEQQPEHRKYTPPPEIDERLMGRTPPPQTPGEAQVQLKLENMDGIAKGDGDAKEDGDSGSVYDVTPTRTRVHPTLKSEGVDEKNNDVHEKSEGELDDELDGQPDKSHDHEHENNNVNDDHDEEEEGNEDNGDDDPFTSPPITPQTSNRRMQEVGICYQWITSGTPGVDKFP